MLVGPPALASEVEHWGRCLKGSFLELRGSYTLRAQAAEAAFGTCKTEERALYMYFLREGGGDAAFAQRGVVTLQVRAKRDMLSLP